MQIYTDFNFILSLFYQTESNSQVLIWERNNGKNYFSLQMYTYVMFFPSTYCVLCTKPPVCCSLGYSYQLWSVWLCGPFCYGRSCSSAHGKRTIKTNKETNKKRLQNPDHNNNRTAVATTSNDNVIPSKGQQRGFLDYPLFGIIFTPDLLHYWRA